MFCSDEEKATLYWKTYMRFDRSRIVGRFTVPAVIHGRRQYIAAEFVLIPCGNCFVVRICMFDF